jgi:hypothetical protein
MQQWIVEELKTVNLPDERLDDRLALLLDRLSANPSASLPQACKGRAELEAAYGFFDNPRTNEHNILAPHKDATLERIRQHKVVFLVQDSTEADLTRPEEVVGGPLSDEKRTGLFVHPLLAFTADRLPLGTVHLDAWARDPKKFRKRHTCKQRPIEEKESRRWPEGYRQACLVARAAPDTEVICMADSESDVYEALLAARPEPGKKMARFIIRACQNRCLAALQPDEARRCLDPAGIEGDSVKLFEAVASTAVLGTLPVRVSRRVALPTEKRKRKKARQSRRAEVTVRAARLKLRGPARLGGRLPDLEVNCVLAREENPPAGQEAVEWLLLTDLPITTVEEVLRVVACYCVRWQAEVFFAVLKGGCKLEQRQLENEERFKTCLAVYLIVAWRVLYMTMLGRREPDVSCEVVFEVDEWRAAYTMAQGKAPQQAPRLGEMIAVVAELGGYIKRAKGGGPPGPKVMWRGLQRLMDFTLCWRTFGPEQVKNKLYGDSVICVGR